MNMEEMFDVYDIQGNHLGVKPKSFCHSTNPGIYHKPVWIWIIGSTGDVLIQKRAETKKFMPNKWDGSATGHVVAGETSLEGCVREVFEEIGLEFKENNFVFLGEFLAQEVWEIGQVYCLNADIPVNEMKLQQEEVSEVKWIPFDEFKKLFMSDDFMPYGKEYKLWVCDELEKQIEKITKNTKTNI
jgi:isopentenyldiphosphate isomerase